MQLEHPSIAARPSHPSARPPRGLPRPGLSWPGLSRLAAALSPALLGLALGACALKPAAQHTPPPPAPAPPLIVQAPPPDEVAPLLAYHLTLRRMTQGELLKELSLLTPQARTPRLTLQMAMTLMLIHGGGDLARAQALLDGVTGSGDADAQPLKPLAQLLASDCAEMRRQAEHAERLGAQLRDAQRRTEQLNDIVEGLKEIERAMPARPAANSGVIK